MRSRYLHTTIVRHRRCPETPPAMPKINKFTDSDMVKCTIAIRNHLRNGRCDAALRLFNSMPRKSEVIYGTMISGCFSSGNVKLAHQLFDEMPVKNLVAQNIMIKGYIKNNNLSAARKLFDEMPIKDVFSWNTMLSGYVKNGSMDEAKRVFDGMPVKDVVSWTVMLSGYVKNGSMDEAKRVFDRIPVKNVFTWNTMMSGYVQNGLMDEAKSFFDGMPVKDAASWDTILFGYVKNGSMDEAKRVFDQMPVKDVVSWNTIISGYVQNGLMDEARRDFDRMPVKDVFSWTTMMAGYVQNGSVDEAKKVFDQMPTKNVVSWNAMLSGYVQNGLMDEAKSFFDGMPVKDVASWNTMLVGYSQNGLMGEAIKVFNQMPHRNCITWTSIIAGYNKNGDYEEALLIFTEAMNDREMLNANTFASVVSACADIVAFELGKQIHGHVVKGGFADCNVDNALVSMYCKCGSISEAYEIFDRIEDKNVMSWNTLIVGYARHGLGQEALQLFESMKLSCIKHNDITMVGVLMACSHCGFVEEGKHYFYSMTEDQNIVADLRHYSCLIDLLGRTGRLDEAYDLVKSMPFEPHANIWKSLLGACKNHGNIKLGEKAAEMLLLTDPWDSSVYVLLANLYVDSGRWEDAEKIRLKMKDSGLRKPIGYSWVEVSNKTHKFSAGDFTHPESESICSFLEELYVRIKENGYVSLTKSVLHNVEDEEKQHSLKYHSERLAVAYGIMKTPSGRPVCVFKNLRGCEDCHIVMKLISKITGRSIILRDSNRFHHIEDGECNCGDYW